MVRPGQSPNDGDIERLDPRFLSPHPPMLMVNPLTAADNEPRSGSSWTNSDSRRPKIIMCHGQKCATQPRREARARHPYLLGHFDPCHSNFSKLDLMLKIMPLSGMILNVTPNFTELWWHESNFPKKKKPSTSILPFHQQRFTFSGRIIIAASRLGSLNMDRRYGLPNLCN